MVELTLLIIKPDAFGKNLVGSIINILKKRGLTVFFHKHIHLTDFQARKLYQVHYSKSYFNYLIKFMISGTSEVLIVSGENAVRRVNEICGHNDPKKALPGTLRRIYGTGKTRNAVHSSASTEDFLSELEIIFGRKKISKMISNKK